MPNKLILNVVTQTETRGLDSLGGKLQRTGLNLTKFVTAPLVAAGAAAVKLGSDAQKADARFEQAFKNMGKQAGVTLDQLTEQADRLADSTAFDDDAIKEAQASLLSFGAVSGDAFQRTIDLSADMAEALGKDPVDAAALLGKALSDPEKGIAKLARSGVVLTDSQKEQVAALQETGDTLGAQTVILDAIAQRYEGVAGAVNQTDAGKAAQSFEELAEAGESIGVLLLPVLSTLTGFLKDVAVWFQNLDPGVQQFIVNAAAMAAALGPAVFAIGKLVGAFKGVIVVFNLLKIALLTNPFTALAVAVAAIAALIILNWDKIFAFLKGVWEKITNALSGVAKFFSDAWKGIADAATGAWNGIAGIIKGAINGIIDVINGLFGFLNGIQIGIPEINVGPVHIGGGVIDPFNIGLIPHLAEGGIIDRPTLALLGEGGGKEAVVPLDKAGLGEQHFHSHIEVKGQDPFIRNEDDLIRANNRIAFLAGF